MDNCPYCGTKLLKTNYGRRHCPNCGILPEDEITNSDEELRKSYLGNFLIIFTALIIFTTLASAQDLNLKLEPHYFLDGNPILIYSQNQSYDGINFNIVGENTLTDSRILNIAILKASPDVFYNSLDLSKVEILRIAQTKILWTSGIMDLKKYYSENNVTFLLGVNSVSENGKKEYNEVQYTIFLNFNKQQNLIETIGGKIWPSNPGWGFVAGIILIIALIFGLSKTKYF